LKESYLQNANNTDKLKSK